MKLEDRARARTTSPRRAALGGGEAAPEEDAPPTIGEETERTLSTARYDTVRSFAQGQLPPEQEATLFADPQLRNAAAQAAFKEACQKVLAVAKGDAGGD